MRFVRGSNPRPEIIPMPQISGLYTFPTGSPVDPTELNDNFDIVADAFNDSAIRDDEIVRRRDDRVT